MKIFAACADMKCWPQLFRQMNDTIKISPIFIIQIELFYSENVAIKLVDDDAEARERYRNKMHYVHWASS